VIQLNPTIPVLTPKGSWLGIFFNWSITRTWSWVGCVPR